MGFGIMTKKVFAKDEVLLKIGTLKDRSTTYKKDPHRPYAKKEQKAINMVDAPTLQKLATQREHKFTFPITPWIILQDFIKKGSLKPLDRRAQDDSVDTNNQDLYYSYHQKRGHEIKKCKPFDGIILYMIAQGKYEVRDTPPRETPIYHVANTISIYEYMCYH